MSALRVRSSKICSSVAEINASRVGKWCCAAPLDTPARWATAATVADAHPS
ncbi:Uncharacterised protein [Mycobacteroides abscessus subsp. abscessus]|nr:Uncharacterised protein [Mycobacteroides abscessus subsp. abscessus]